MNLLRPIAVLGLVTTLALGISSSSEAHPGDGRLLLTWHGAPAGAASLVLLEPAGGGQAVALTPSGEKGSGTVRFRPVPGGVVRCELRSGDNTVLRAWKISLAAALTTTAELDLETGALRVDPAHPDPFGDVEGWDAVELEALPGRAAAAALDLNTTARATVDPLVDGRTQAIHARLYPEEYGLENDVAGVQVPLGTPGPGESTARAQISCSHPGITGAGALYTAGSGGRHLGQVQGTLDRRLGFLGQVQAHLLVQGLSFSDAGPVGIDNGKLPNNRLEGLETRGEFWLRPAAEGLARLNFYAVGEKRHHFLQQYRQDSAHSPRQDRADLIASAAYDHRLGRTDLFAEAAYSRAFLETGDGTAFDNFDLYDIGLDPANQDTATTADHLYWWGGGIKGQHYLPPHLYNYYLRDLTSTWTLRAEGRCDLAEEAPLRLGAEFRTTTYRFYEHLNPISAGQQGWSGGGSQYASRLGYSVDGKTRVENGIYAPPTPDWAAFFVAQRGSLGPLSLEGGLRAEQFRSGQRPLRNLAEPLEAESDTVPAASRLGSAPSHWGLAPRLGAHLRTGGTDLWLDGGITRRDPPLEALYYSPTLLIFYAGRAAHGGVPGVRANYIFGNPELKPETAATGHFGLSHRIGSGMAVNLSASMASVRDTWVATQVPVAGDTLNYYRNQGRRRERGLHLGLRLVASERTRLRFLYDLSKVETNVVEPAPLLRTLLLPGTAAEGSGVRETAPLTPAVFQNGPERDYFPSLFDRRHRFSVSLQSRLDEPSAAEGPGALLGGTTLGVTFRAASGAPYTPTYVDKEGDLYTSAEAQQLARVIAGRGINSGRMPWTWQLDLALRKNIGIFGGNIALAFEILNLTGQRNVRAVYGATGKADDDGWLESPADPDRPGGLTNAQTLSGQATKNYQDRLENPLNYDEGRAFRLAVSFGY